MRRLLLTSAMMLLLLGLTPAALCARDAGKRAAIELIAVTQTGRNVAGTRFSLEDVRDLRIVTWWTVRGGHVQRLELHAPGGALYQRLIQPFDVTKATGRPRRGQPRGTPVETLLPVGGTWITDHSLVGEWRVDVYLDNDRTPVASRSFVLDH